MTVMAGTTSTQVEGAHANGSWRRHLLVIVPILIVYFALAFFRIGHQSLWLDEATSIRIANLDDASFYKAIRNRKHGFIYVTLLRYWQRFGNSEAFLRTLSALAGGLAVVLTYVMCLRHFPQRVAVIGTLMLATSPFFIWYSQELRYITLSIATSLFAMYTFDLAVSKGSPRRWLTYGGATLLAACSFMPFLTLSIAQGLYLLWAKPYRHGWRIWCLLQAIIFALCIYWISGYYMRTVVHTVEVGGQQRTSIDLNRLKTGAGRELSPAVLPYTFFALSTGFSLGPSLRELHESRAFTTLVAYTPVIAIPAVVFGGLFVLGMIAVWQRPNIGKWLALWLFVPIVSMYGIVAFTGLAYNVRYVAMILPAYVLIVAAGLSRIRPTVMQITLLGTVLCVSGFSLANYYFNPRYARADTRAAAQYLKAMASSQDMILVVGKARALRYYDRGETPIMEWPRHAPHDRQGIETQLQTFVSGRDRLWYVALRSWERDPKGAVKALLSQSYDQVHQQGFAGVEITGYQLSLEPARSIRDQN